MPAHIGVENITDLEAQAGGYINEASVEKSVEAATVRDQVGNVVIAKPKKLVTETQVIKGKGDPGLATVTEGGFTADPATIIEVKGTESSEDFPDFEVTARVFSSLAD